MTYFPRKVEAEWAKQIQLCRLNNDDFYNELFSKTLQYYGLIFSIGKLILQLLFAT